MGGIHTLLLKDSKNMTCFNMTFLSQEMVELLEHNVVEMQNEKMSISIQSSDLDIQKSEIEKQGWTFDDALYERLLLEYTKLTNKVLTRWKR
jgi:hypothetical protein